MRLGRLDGGKRLAIVAGLTVGLAACAAETANQSVAGFYAQRLAPPPTDYTALLSHPDRLGADFADDATRKPDKVLAFAGVGYGMTVIELAAEAGYYAELLSYAVGSDGQVLLQTPPELDASFDGRIGQRLADNRLPNVQRLRGGLDDLPVRDGAADLATWLRGSNVPSNLAVSTVIFGEIARVLKPGGILVMSDQVVPADDRPRSPRWLMRLDCPSSRKATVRPIQGMRPAGCFLNFKSARWPPCLNCAHLSLKISPS